MVEAFVDGFRDAMLWSAWIFGLSCGLGVILAVVSILRLGGEWGAFWWKDCSATPAPQEEPTRPPQE